VRVDAGRTPKTNIAVRRTLQAAGERTDPSDALIDCVVAWDNLVGSSAGESTFGVSSALGWLSINQCARIMSPTISHGRHTQPLLLRREPSIEARRLAKPLRKSPKCANIVSLLLIQLLIDPVAS
jgi:hypothetical protein